MSQYLGGVPRTPRDHVREAQSGWPVGFGLAAPDLVGVCGREDTPHAVRIELERSAFLRGTTVAPDEQRHARFHSVYFRCPERYVSNVTVEYRFGFSKHNADLEPEYMNRCIAWMRVNTDMYAIGRERGDRDRHLHMNGCFGAHFKCDKGLLVSAKAHMRQWFGLCKGKTGYSIFMQPFRYRYGHNLESYLGYGVKDFGSSWFAYYHSPDVTPARIERAALLRRLLDSGRVDQICIKKETLFSQVESFYYIHFSFCTPRPRFDVLLCWMIQSGRYYLHQSLVIAAAASGSSVATACMAYAFCDAPWLCDLATLWAVIFGIACIPRKRTRSTDETDQDAEEHECVVFWRLLDRIPVMKRYARAYDEMTRFSPASGCTQSLDDLSDAEDNAGKIRERRPSLTMRVPDSFRDKITPWSKDELMCNSGRFDLDVHGQGWCFFLAISIQVLFQHGATSSLGCFGSSLSFESQLGSHLGVGLVSLGLRAYAHEIAVAMLSSYSGGGHFGDIEATFGTEVFANETDKVLWYLWNRARLLMSTDKSVANDIGDPKTDSPWGPGAMLCDCMAICAVLQQTVWHYVDGHKDITQISIDEYAVISVREVPMNSSLDIGEMDIVLNLTANGTHYHAALFASAYTPPVVAMTGAFDANVDDVLTKYHKPSIVSAEPIIVEGTVLANVHPPEIHSVQSPIGLYKGAVCRAIHAEGQVVMFPIAAANAIAQYASRLVVTSPLEGARSVARRLNMDTP